MQYDNLLKHQQTLKADMKKVQDEITDSPLLSSERLIETQKRYTDLQLAYNFVDQMMMVLFPPKIQTPGGHPFRELKN